MSDTNLLMLSIGPVSVMVNADREAKGISEAQLTRKWETRRAVRERRTARRTTVAVDCHPALRVECRRSSS